MATMEWTASGCTRAPPPAATLRTMLRRTQREMLSGQASFWDARTCSSRAQLCKDDRLAVDPACCLHDMPYEQHVGHTVIARLSLDTVDSPVSPPAGWERLLIRYAIASVRLPVCQP